ncbi:CLUMA_CG015241, isoform A [Clunio marinus]|uniref:CLUMA_CG015241, isoform A n=1 Tax=Clunio marinus TaxID=568069 RepID=A0A1J1IRU4_9DIPT|nr:CLUMA_CG015241, isoform A [Clunio marinus]
MSNDLHQCERISSLIHLLVSSFHLDVQNTAGL